MGGSSNQRRKGRSRRRTAGSPPSGAERRVAERRQFPPSEDPGTVSDRARELQQAIDAYKQARGLKHICVTGLLDVLEELGYRKVG